MGRKKRTTSIKKRLSMLKFSVDDLVFAQHRNRPQWPGKVLQLPDEENKKYKVLLFGSKEEILAPEKNLFHFEDNFSLFGRPTDNDDLNDGLWEALFDPGLLGLQRPQRLRAILKESYDSKTKDATKSSPRTSATTTTTATKTTEILSVVPEGKPGKNKKKPLAEKLSIDWNQNEMDSSSASSPHSIVPPATPERFILRDHRRRSTPFATPNPDNSARDSPDTPANSRATCLALKVPNNTPLSPPKNKRTTRGLKRCSQEPQDALNDASLFMERIQALELKQKNKRRSK